MTIMTDGLDYSLLLLLKADLCLWQSSASCQDSSQRYKNDYLNHEWETLQTFLPLYNATHWLAFSFAQGVAHVAE